MGYKSVCLECKKAYNNYIDLDSHKKEICPDCGETMSFLSHMFKPPKKTDSKKWEVVKYLVENGFNYYHTYDMIEPGVYKQLGKYPETMKEAQEFVKTFNPNGAKK
ncbi:MAG: hypothetical protein ACFHU9_05865 [Fluviicola sp.]